MLISDSHSYIDDAIIRAAKESDELWHAGDWGDISLSDCLSKLVPIRGVYGNIDGAEIRKTYPKELFFELDKLKVYMTHIGGYPGRYQREVKNRLIETKPDLFISGHSHILKVMRDNALGLMHFNPGAIGLKGFHRKRTMLRFSIDAGTISDLRVIEYDKIFEE